MTTTVKVAKYRYDTDYLFRIANVDYPACVGVREVEYWKITAAHVLTETEGLKCSRATAYDREQFANAIAAVKTKLIAADARITHLKMKREVVGLCNAHLAQDCHNGCPYRVRVEPSNQSSNTSVAIMTVCADCAKETALDSLAKALFQCAGLSERLDPGSEVPAGECECGAFAYLIPTHGEQLAAAQIARYVYDLVADEFFADDELPDIKWLKTKLREAGMPVAERECEQKKGLQ